MKSLQNSFKKESIVTEIKGNSYFRNLRTFNINYFDDFGIDQHSKLIDKYFYRHGAFRKEISEKEADDYPSLTNKIIFKCMDIIEEIA